VPGARVTRRIAVLHDDQPFETTPSRSIALVAVVALVLLLVVIGLAACGGIAWYAMLHHAPSAPVAPGPSVAPAPAEAPGP
jgi:hypothetical protein